MKCKICNNSHENKVYEVKEMMFGFRDIFTYFQCSICGCLQIAEFPVDMSRYYPSNYFSFLLPSTQRSGNRIKRLIKKKRGRYAIFNKGVLGKLIYTFFPNDTLRMLSRICLTENSAILDVGCGSGFLLNYLSEIGFKHLLGVDPYIKEDIEYENGLKILKKSIHKLDDKWDLIMFHHSFEHIPDPLETLQSVSRLLTERGVCLIRIPTVSSYAWEHYKENWVQLDAPRHLFIHSIKDIALLAEKVNLVLEEIVYDSTDFQFWGSEQYIRDIPLTAPHSYSVAPSNSIFSDIEIASFKQKAKELNQKNQGDSCAFFLRKD
ncbi:MAG: class I SAM-dependent methyltransferase [Bacteroidales bacterium]|nr:MAG: class I SAM-dependent methyltransferase [Bacteroidales bacterium]